VARNPSRRIDTSQLRITRGALLLLCLEVGLSIVFNVSSPSAQALVVTWFVPTPSSVWHDWKVWTLLSGPLLQPSFFPLLFDALMLWLFVPTIERWWGTPRFLRFAAYTSVAGTVVGTLAGLLTGRDVPILGLQAFVTASIVAFGLLYARQPVRFFGALPMTGRQLMYGILGFQLLFTLLNGRWEEGAGVAAAAVLAAMLISDRWNPRLAWVRWRGRRARSRFDVLDGGKRKDKYVN